MMLIIFYIKNKVFNIYIIVSFKSIVIKNECSIIHKHLFKRTYLRKYIYIVLNNIYIYIYIYNNKLIILEIAYTFNISIHCY